MRLPRRRTIPLVLALPLLIEGWVVRLLLVAVALTVVWNGPLAAQAVGDRVVLHSSNNAGVPVHPAAGDPTYVRWANGTQGRVTAIDAPTGWRKVEAHGVTGWVTQRYLTLVVEDAEDPEAPADEVLTYVVGTWNLEHFHDGASRGFPENTYANPGPTYPSRTPAEFQATAQLIRDQLKAAILVLNEIFGAGPGRSVELDRLVAALGGDWAYEIAKSGGSQRVAILFDSSAARRASCLELVVSPKTVQGKDIFERDPLVCRFVLRDRTGAPMNDLLVVGVHLASGQQLNTNHNEAMTALRNRLRQAVQAGSFPAGERDVLIAGDFNASRYDAKLENFWGNYDPTGYRFATLSPEDGTEYPGTRLAGVPLYPKSQIDYLLGSEDLKAELVLPMAAVHVELLPVSFQDFRAAYSDHIPVTVSVRVVPDNDP